MSDPADREWLSKHVGDDILDDIFNAADHYAQRGRFSETLMGVRPQTVQRMITEIRDRRAADAADRDVARHVAYVEPDSESLRRGGTSRTARCLCGWRGTERGTLELAADDALTHEREHR